MLTQTQKDALLQRNKARIIDLLKWSQDEYSVFIWNCGLRYLGLYLVKDEAAIRDLESRKVFWNWWINLWNARDEAFVEEFDGLEDGYTDARLRAIYYRIHKPETLATELHPPRVVFGENFTNHTLQS
jgi:hypothetical protein